MSKWMDELFWQFSSQLPENYWGREEVQTLRLLSEQLNKALSFENRQLLKAYENAWEDVRQVESRCLFEHALAFGMELGRLE